MNNLEVTATSGPSAKIICDSVNEWGQRLTTMEVRMHRFVLAEMNTHRVFSRNSASSRAIPVSKIIQRILDDPAYPVHWGTEQKGMQSGNLVSAMQAENCLYWWNKAKYAAIEFAEALMGVQLHKSLINRLLEPFMWHTAIITATEWDNFFHQRCHPDAQPEMKAVADAMQIVYFMSTPKELAHGEWHMPYITDQDRDDLNKPELYPDNTYDQDTEKLKQISVARCARVSYLTHDGVRDPSKDLELFDRLKGSGHWSPFEHVATPIAGERYVKFLDEANDPKQVYFGCGNFRGWKQFRKEFRNENRTNFIPNLPELAPVAMRMQKARMEQVGYKPGEVVNQIESRRRDDDPHPKDVAFRQGIGTEESSQ